MKTIEGGDVSISFSHLIGEMYQNLSLYLYSYESVVVNSAKWQTKLEMYLLNCVEIKILLNELNIMYPKYLKNSSYMKIQHISFNLLIEQCKSKSAL